jgi:prepilin-type N-terminal cleavage/methylation domain-containing protein
MRSKFGFTLIELLIVIGVLGVLASVLVVIINPVTQFQKARDAKRKSELAQLAKAMEVYYNDHGKYPDDGSGGNPDAGRWFFIDNASVTHHWGQSWSPYIETIPEEPTTTCPGGGCDGARHYQYLASFSHQAFCLYANLDRNTDPQACNSGNRCTGPLIAGTDGDEIHCGVDAGHPCNYGICSSNVEP